MPLATTSNDIKVYSLSSDFASVIPDWLAKKKGHILKRDSDWTKRVQLIQDFEFPEASIRIKATKDGKHLVATGVYQPQIRVWELADLSLKFKRHTDCDNVQFLLLSDDWTKSVHLQSDRYLEFHTQGGVHYRTRIPKFGRDMAYHYPTCDVLVAGASNDVFRLDLSQGRFVSPLETNLEDINTCKINPAHQLFGFGGIHNMSEFWDPRSSRKVASIDVTQDLLSSPNFDSSILTSSHTIPSITSLAFDNDGLTVALGTSTGQVLLYDMRSSSPWLIKDHQYGFGIKNVHFHGSGQVISCDQKIMKIWDKQQGDIFTSVEPPSNINDICVVEDSGLIMMANEGVQLQSYFIPRLATAPKWCSFLDSLTEEMEETKGTTQYDDYKFVTKKELANLGLDHLIGTNMLRAYMHGFFIDLRLYQKAKAISNPFEYDEYRKKVVKERIEERRASRILTKKKLPKVNKKLAERITEDSFNDNIKETPLGDSRFGNMFTNPEFEIDETCPEYKFIHPHLEAKRVKSKKKQGLASALMNEGDVLVSEDSSGSDEEKVFLEKDKSNKGKRKPKMYQIKSQSSTWQ